QRRRRAARFDFVLAFEVIVAAIEIAARIRVTPDVAALTRSVEAARAQTVRTSRLGSEREQRAVVRPDRAALRFAVAQLDQCIERGGRREAQRAARRPAIGVVAGVPGQAILAVAVIL